MTAPDRPTETESWLTTYLHKPENRHAHEAERERQELSGSRAHRLRLIASRLERQVISECGDMARDEMSTSCAAKCEEAEWLRELAVAVDAMEAELACVAHDHAAPDRPTEPQEPDAWGVFLPDGHFLESFENEAAARAEVGMLARTDNPGCTYGPLYRSHPAAPRESEEMVGALTKELDAYREVLATAYAGILWASWSEDGLDAAHGDEILDRIRRIWPAVMNHPDVAALSSLSPEVPDA